ncbi:MAG: ShlB/FhaC/HecB family hemolysin secretion/activation protein [Betaproteobacteria bacterium]|nr:ShlB/FhaC/HecB family hemolysin secretion/activation protein [Betaproteobacteria bacterium]
MNPEEYNSVLAQFTGKDKDFGDVQRALEALQAAYQRQGYGGVEIRLPEQELERGVVRFRVIEAKIRKITVEGNEHFSAANVRRSIPSLREGETPNSLEIARSIRLANENSSKQTAVLLRAAGREDQVDAAIRVTDINPKRWSVSLDNTGTENTHRYRLGIAYQHANLFDRDHVLTAQFVTSPGNHHDVEIYGVGYRIPIYALGDSIDLVAGYSTVDSGTVQDLFTVAGKGTILVARYNHALPKWGDLEHKLSFGLDYRAYQNQVVPVGGIDTLVPDITLNPLSITYSGSLKGEQRELGFYLSMSQNFPVLNDGKDSDFKKIGTRFPDGTAGYRLFRMGLNYARAFAGDWQFRVRWDAQYTDDALVAGEQFAIGGADNVRGFAERYRTDDKGYRTNLEIYTPDAAKLIGLDGGRLRFLTFYDFGKATRNREFGAETMGASLDSMGFGLRMNYKTNFTLRLDVAHVFHDGTQFNEPTGKRNSKKGHFSAAWVW